MCLAVPARIVALAEDGTATVDLGGVRTAVSLALLDEAAVGEYVIVHTGFALTRVDPAEAERTLALMREAGVVADSGEAAWSVPNVAPTPALPRARGREGPAQREGGGDRQREASDLSP